MRESRMMKCDWEKLLPHDDSIVMGSCNGAIYDAEAVNEYLYCPYCGHEIRSVLKPKKVEVEVKSLINLMADLADSEGSF